MSEIISENIKRQPLYQQGYEQGRLDAIEDVKEIVNHWLIHESGKCLECGNRLSADIEQIKEQKND